MNTINRRQMIQLLGAGAASVYLGGCTKVPYQDTSSSGQSDWLKHFGPVNRTLGDIAPREFSGDQPSQAHHILWEKAKFIKQIGGLPQPTETVPLVIVGGGMSGILSAYQLRDLKPVVLEQAARFGGNSRAESWRGIDYSLATAYFGVPDPGSDIEKFFSELGIDKMYRARNAEDPIYIDGKRYDDVWTKGTNEQSRPQFVKLAQHFTDIVKEQHGFKYPDIPITDDEDRDYVEKLDKVSFLQYIRNFLGEPLHPHVEWALEGYFWSSCAASSTEYSAAAGLNFFAADFASIAICRGGNAAVAERVLQEVTKTVPTQNLRAGCLVFDVKTEKDGVVVTYAMGDQIKAIKAKTVIMSCPKFIAGHLIDDLEAERRNVYKTLRYRSYLVANLLLNESLDDSFYDLYFFKSGSIDTKHVEASAKKQRITDMVFGNYPQGKSPQTILTLFRGYPYDGARKQLLAPDSYQKARTAFEDQVNNEILPLLNIKKSDVVDLRLSRWGHPLPVADTGTIAGGKVRWLREPFKDRVFFVEQDNWMLPCFETCFHESFHWAPKVRKVAEA